LKWENRALSVGEVPREGAYVPVFISDDFLL
jgi:hypothetical protein